MKNKLMIFCGVIFVIFSIPQIMASVMPPQIYEIDYKQSKVYFGFVEIVDADINTFTILDPDSYAKDKNHVYHGKDIIDFMNPSEIEYLGYGALKDNKNVYRANKIVLGADPKTYKVLAVEDSMTYGKDKNAIFYGLKKMDGVDINTFTPLNNKYAKDKNSVYFWGKKIENSDGSSFIILSGDTGKDKNYVYYNDKIIKGADPDTFNILNQKKKLNGYGEPMNGYGYAKDKSHVYYSGKVIAGAHLKSFKERIYGYAEDRNHIYYFGEVVGNADPKTFVEPPYQHIDL